MSGAGVRTRISASVVVEEIVEQLCELLRPVRVKAVYAFR
jgi:hypothetical protein